MRNTLLEISDIDAYLEGRMGPAEAAAFRAHILVSGDLGEKVERQERAHLLIRRFGRSEERRRLDRIFHTLMTEDVFRSLIMTP